MIATQYINLDMTPGGVLPVFQCSQYDIGRPLGMVVYNGGEAVDISGYTCTIEATRSDGTAITAAVTSEGEIGVFVTTATMTNVADKYDAQLVLTDGGGNRVASLPFIMRVVAAAMDENAEAIEEDASLYRQYTATVQTIIAAIRTDLTAEVTARQSAVSAEATARANAVSAEATARASAITAEANARQTADSQLQSDINAEAAARQAADAVLQSEIDNIISPSGEAPSSAEVENARIGVNGTTYTTLGNAIRGQVGDVNVQLKQENAYDLFRDFCTYTDGTAAGVSFTWNSDKTVCTVNGTATSASAYNRLYGSVSIVPTSVVPGKTYYLNVKCSTGSDGLSLRVYWYRGGSSSTETAGSFSKSGTITVPGDVTGCIFRIQLSSGATVSNATISVAMTEAKTNSTLTDEQFWKGAPTGYASVDEITKNGIYYIWDGLTIAGFPYVSGWLFVYESILEDRQTLQVAVDWGGAEYARNHVLYRTQNQTAWRDWTPFNYNVPFEKAVTDIFDYNTFDLIDHEAGESGTVNGVTYTKIDSHHWTVNGTATGVSFRNLINFLSGNLPNYIVPGRTYKVSVTNSDNVRLQVFYTYEDSTMEGVTVRDEDEFTIPAEAIGFLVRLRVLSGVTVSNESIAVSILAVPVLGGSGGTVINQEIHNDTFNNTYTSTINPQITTDANGWLQPIDTESADESGKTDMTPAIMAMLTSAGYCHLAPGIFYVSGNIDLPQGAKIEGCGRDTIVRLLSSVTEGYVFKMEKYNTISNLRISGAYTDLNPGGFTANKGTRHGLLFVSQYEEGTSQTEYSTADNLFIDNFTGCGIKCDNTSINVARGMYLNRAQIVRCQTGVFVDAYSEFNKFEQVMTHNCYIGCENDGGNNVFMGCTFHAANTGFLIDNSLGDKPNNSHGAVIGCTFCHVGSNTGIGVAVKGAEHGYLFSGCQVWYCSILVENSYGIAFTGMEFGRGTTGAGATIVIDGGGTVMFTGCSFQNDINYPPVISISNNDKVRFTGCYGSHSGNEITAS